MKPLFDKKTNPTLIFFSVPHTTLEYTLFRKEREYAYSIVRAGRRVAEHVRFGNLFMCGWKKSPSGPPAKLYCTDRNKAWQKRDAGRPPDDAELSFFSEPRSVRDFAQHRGTDFSVSSVWVKRRVERGVLFLAGQAATRGPPAQLYCSDARKACLAQVRWLLAEEAKGAEEAA